MDIDLKNIRIRTEIVEERGNITELRIHPKDERLWRKVREKSHQAYEERLKETINVRATYPPVWGIPEGY